MSNFGVRCGLKNKSPSCIKTIIGLVPTLSQTLNSGDSSADIFFPGGNDMIISGTNQIFLNNGTAANPTIAFTSDIDSGVFSLGVDGLGIANGGSTIASFLDVAGDFQLNVGGFGGALVSNATIAANGNNSIVSVGGATATGIATISLGNDQTAFAGITLSTGFLNGWTLQRAAGSDAFAITGNGSFASTVAQINHVANTSQGVFNTQAIGTGLNNEFFNSTPFPLPLVLVRS